VPDVDLAIRNARIVTSHHDVIASLFVKDQVIVGIGNIHLSASQDVDATGLILLPGMIDAHVHFMDPGDSSREDFPAGSSAAAVAGVTTVLEHSHGHPVYDKKSFREKREYLKNRSVVDFGLAAHISPFRIEDTLEVCNEGAVFIKVFTCNTHGIKATSNGYFFEAMKRINRNRGAFLVHAEDDSLTEISEKILKSSGREDGGVIPEWRNPLAEQIAVASTGRMTAHADTRVIIAHCSHPEVINIIHYFRSQGADLWAECCPQYLYLLRDEIYEKKGLGKFTPPARAKTEVELKQMWEKVREGNIHYIASDHAPSTRKQKESGSIWDVPFGLPGIDTTLPILINAVIEGKLSWNRLVELYSEVPAKIYGLYPKKGSLQIGSDADFVLIDPEKKFSITDEYIISKAGWSSYSGIELKGKIVATYLRGQKIAEEHKCTVMPGFGKFIKRVFS